MGLGARSLRKTWQVGDGREERLAHYVVRHAERGNPRSVLDAIDDYARHESFLMNVGDEKGLILDDAIRERAPRRILELGTYCGYGALRMAIAAPEASVVSVEFSDANAGVARRVHAHAGVDDRVTVVVGTVGDGGRTVERLKAISAEAGGPFELVFLDHDKACYVPDLHTLMAEGLLTEDATAVADNVRIPGAPEYHRYMMGAEGAGWTTIKHVTRVEYQNLLEDWVLVSKRLPRAS